MTLVELRALPRVVAAKWDADTATVMVGIENGYHARDLGYPWTVDASAEGGPMDARMVYLRPHKYDPDAYLTPDARDRLSVRQWRQEGLRRLANQGPNGALADWFRAVVADLDA